MHSNNSIFSSVPTPAKGSHLEQAAALAITRSSTAGEKAPSRAPRSNVISDHEHRESIVNALSDIATVVGRTLGDKVVVFYEKNGAEVPDYEGKIGLISANDKKAGPRHIKWLKSIEVVRIK